MGKSYKDRDYDRDSRNARLAKQAEKQDRDAKRAGHRMHEQDLIDNEDFFDEPVYNPEDDR